MPFEVFRRHQRKLLAIFAILAMFGFVVSDSLPKLLNSSYGGRDQPVVETLRQDGLSQRPQRDGSSSGATPTSSSRELNPYRRPDIRSAGLKDRDMVDALILQHEADRLGIPAGPEMGREFLKQITGGRMNRDLFEALLGRFNNRVSGEQLLADIANQVRLAQCPAAARLPDGHSLRRLPGLSRPERAGRGQARRGPRREVPRQGPRADRRTSSRPTTTNTRTCSPTPRATRPDSRSRVRSRSRSSRSTAMPWPAASRTS